MVRTHFNPLVSVVILNWKKPHDTLECIASLKHQTYKNTEIIVVENGSGDDSEEILSKVQGITLVVNEKNRGFTGGHIDGLKHTSGDLIFVLNNDAVVDPNYIKIAVDLFNKNPNTAVVGGRSYAWRVEADKYKTDKSYYAFQTINPVTAEGIFVANDSEYSHRTYWVSGSAMIIKREVIDKVGYFYDPMFAYYEESDLFARILIHDYDIVYSPDLRIWHKMGASSSSYFQYLQLFKNRAAFATRNLVSTSYMHFLKSYMSTSLRSLLKGALGWKSLPAEERQITKARLIALLSVVLHTPLWFISKRKLRVRDSNGLTYSELLRQSSIGLSYVYDADGLNLTDNTVIEAIKQACFHHYQIEFIVVCRSKSTYSKYQKILSKQLSDFPVFLCYNKQQSHSNYMNLGWLSSSKEQIVFTKQIPSTSDIDSALGYVDNNNSIFANYKDDVIISRSLLALYGGLIFDDLENSFAALSDFANHFDNAVVAGYAINFTDESLSSIAKSRRISSIDQYNDIKRNRSLWSKILERYYRIYQLWNLLLFIVLPGIPIRLRLARLKNVLLYVVKFNRKSLALELKHMNNDVVKQLHHGFDLQQRKDEISKKTDIGLNSWKETPVFIICRDRVSTLKQLLNWLESVGMSNIFLIDNDSDYPELVRYLNECPYQVIYTKKNIGHTVAWSEGIVKTLCYGEYYILSDPDVIPDSECPDDAVRYFYELHKKYPDYHKAGFGLKIDDLPDHYPLKREVINWEEQFWKTELEPNVFDAGIDTTFALYKPYTYKYTLHPSIRTGRPYVASHLPWYTNGTLLDEEEAYYRMRASQNITSWNSNEVLDRYKKVLK